MLPLTSATPTTAERIRSACARAGGALLAVEREDPVATPLHHLLPDGSFAVAVSAGSGTREGTGRAGDPLSGSQALLELTDYAPLPLREPVRSLVWVRGWLRPVPPAAVTSTLDLIASADPNPVLLQFKTPMIHAGRRGRGPVHAAAARDRVRGGGRRDRCRAGQRPGPARRRARPVLRDRIEPAVALGIRPQRRAGAAGVQAARPLRRGRVRPLGLDRYGVRFRVEGDPESGQGDHDIRLPFHKPVDDMVGLGQAIRVLMGCPFINGLRARR